MGSPSQSLPTSLRPLILMTKLRKIPPSLLSNQAGGGTVPERKLVERQVRVAGKGGKVMARPCHERSEDKSFRGRDAVVGEGQETSFWKVLREGTAAAKIRSRASHLGCWEPRVHRSQYSRLICLEALSLMELTR